MVVASAGDTGPDTQSIGVPGNVPYIITAGAMSDDYTPEDGADDVLASFSAAEPTYEGFVKPDVVAPGGHMLGLMRNDMQIAIDHPEFHNGANYYETSGTFQSAAVVSGTEHYGGRANQDANGDYYIMGIDGYLWSDGYL